MADDYGRTWTDKALSDLENRITKVYSQAANEMQDTVNLYFNRYVQRDAEEEALYLSGKISKADYTQWRINNIGRGERYQDLQTKLTNRYYDADVVARAYINDATPSIYSLNRNYAAFEIESIGPSVSFNLWDESTVRRLIVQNPNLMPNYPEERAVARGIDLAYGREKISEHVLSGILQGKSLPNIANDLQSSLENMSRESALRTARTAVTNAENAGRQDCYEEAEEMGINMQKQWLATMDDRTRDSHVEADGQTVGVDEPFIVGGEELMFPGDDSLGASGENIYNCRCRMITVIDGVDTSDAVRKGKMTYEEWEQHKQEVGEKWI